MVFRKLLFTLLRAGSKYRRILIGLFIIGIVYFISMLIFSSSTPATASFAELTYARLYKNDLAAGETISKEHMEHLRNSTNSKITAGLINQFEKTTSLYVVNNSIVEVLNHDEEHSIALLPECPIIGKNINLNGHVGQAGLLIDDLQEEEVREAHPEIQPGGHWKPTHCQSKRKVAIIIPYRDRYSHLVRLLDFLFPILESQLLDFRFIVTEQYGNDLFNKGRIMNAAFQLAEKLHVDCVIFHDVDMFPQDDRTPYDCPNHDQPRHIGAFVSNLGYQLWYNELVGGVLALTMDDYRAVNGYSNLYWAWGGEDDDMGKRMLSQNFTIERPNQAFARFSMLKHGKRKRTAPKLIYKLLETAGTRWEKDGLNNTGQWSIVKMDLKPLYYHLIVDVGLPPKEWRAEN